jgi:predicted Zn-dependent peptidase
MISVMLEIFAGGKISPLYKEMVQKQRLVTDISYFEAPGTAYSNLVVFSGTVRAPHTNAEVVAAFDQVLRRFQKDGVTQKQVDIAKRILARSYLNGLASNLGLARDLASSELIFGDWKSLLTWFDLVMKVTPADVNRVAKQYLIKKSRTIGMVERKVK